MFDEMEFKESRKREKTEALYSQRRFGFFIEKR